MKAFRRVMILALAVLFVLPAFAACKKTDGEKVAFGSDKTEKPEETENPDETDKTLNLLNWGDYLDPELKTKFEQQTGIKIKETIVTSNEEMLIALDKDDCPYDMCIPSDYAVERLIAKGRLAEIDYSNIPNFENIDKDLLKKCEVFDPGNKYSVPYTWGILGIMYNTKKVDAADVGSWDQLWNEKYAGQIYMYDSIRDSMAAALLKCGCSINTNSESEIRQAADALIELNETGLVKAWLTDDIKDDMVNGSGAAALIYSGDAVWCMNADEDGNADLSFYVPREGSNIYFDNMVITANSKKKAMAEEFINFLLDPENAAQNTEYIGYSSPNTAVAALIDGYFLNCPAYNFDRATIDRCEVLRDFDDMKEEFYEKEWRRIFK